MDERTGVVDIGAEHHRLADGGAPRCREARSLEQATDAVGITHRERLRRLSGGGAGRSRPAASAAAMAMIHSLPDGACQTSMTSRPPGTSALARLA